MTFTAQAIRLLFLMAALTLPPRLASSEGTVALLARVAPDSRSLPAEGEPLQAEEWKLGAALSELLAEQEGFVITGELRAQFETLAIQLVGPSTAAGHPLSFHLIATPHRDAFSLPGGQLYLSTGMVGSVTSAAELRAVLHHQLAHGERRHAFGRLVHSYGTRVLELMARGEKRGALAGIAANLKSAGILSRNSLEAEREADESESHAATARGQSQGFAFFLNGLRDDHGRPTPGSALYLKRHPLSTARLQSAARKPTDGPSGGTEESLLTAFQEKLARAALDRP